MADLVERLKKLGTDSVGNYGMPIAKEAAYEIDTLRARVKELEAALQDCLDTYSRTAKRIPPTTQEAEKMMDDIHRANKRARDLLAKIKEPS